MIELQNFDKVLIYLRLSTESQAKSGLGFDAQLSCISNFLDKSLYSGERLIYKEVASGRREDNRKIFQEVLSLSDKFGFPIIVSTLDRFSRNPEFINDFLIVKKGPVIFAEFPDATEESIKMCAKFALDEINLISKRTKAALQAKKARGAKLGNPEHLLDKHEEAIQNSIKTRKAKADNNPNNKRAIAFLRTLVKEEHTYQEMAEILNREGFVSSHGCSFTKSTVYKLIKRYNLK